MSGLPHDTTRHLHSEALFGPAGKENIPTNVSTADHPKLEKLKRQRSTIPEVNEVVEPTSPGPQTPSRTSMELTNPVSSHFRDAGA